MNLSIKAENRFVLLPIVFILFLLFYLSYRYVVPTEDSVILYDYARNLVTRGLITYSDATFPIEGATDFLWMLLIALFKFVGINEFASVQILNFCATLFILYLTSKLGVNNFIVFVGILITPYLYSSLNGFSTLFFAAVYVWCFYLAIQKKPYLYLSIFVLCLIRPDGVVWGFGLVLFRLLDVQDKEAFNRELKDLCIQLLVPGIVYFGWRAWYFAEWLPLPFIVKGSGPRDLIIFFKGSVKSVGMVFLPVLIAGFFIRDRQLYFKRLLIFFAFPVVFYCSVRLEQNLGNRFLAPMFFGGLLLVALDKRAMALYSFIAVSALLSGFQTYGAIQNATRSSHENIYYISRDLAVVDGGKLLTSEAGRLAYYSNWSTRDSWGLNTPAYAHHMINSDDLKTNAYDMIVGHCNLQYLITDVDPKAHQERSNENHCIALVSYIKSAKYNIFLVPYLTDLNQDCNSGEFYGLGRYDIYAVSPTYRNADAVAEILTKHKAIRFPFDEAKFSVNKIGKLCAVPAHQ
jgi:hypothetical protein